MSADPRRRYDAEGLNVGAVLDGTAAPSITPVHAFFTRSHATPPVIDAATFRLAVDGLVRHPASFNLAELVTHFALHDVPATLLCAGLRRAEFAAIGSLNGELPWGSDPVSTGHWTGVRLADVLRHVGLEDGATHVEFIGLDDVERDGQRFGFGGSITVEKALSVDVLLATHLNGAPLTVVHGAPLRALVPGWIGARSVKWLGRVTVRGDESPNYFQRKAYRVQRVSDPLHPRDVQQGDAMDEVPRNAVIVSPAADSTVAAGPVRVRGWAIGAGGRAVDAVELRVGDGEWVAATLTPPAGPWAWCWWEATVPVPPGSCELTVRAHDAAGAMPESLAHTWNVKGYGNNAWGRRRLIAL
ncbi:MAG: molybdopterin-dependent oxidoreductase [Gemmatimonadaceae bacterium]|jgi:sulfite oxidase|nr:molybdopterin-dependent oxidoreductase [Gemmatimonadaceae bacterium]